VSEDWEVVLRDLILPKNSLIISWASSGVVDCSKAILEAQNAIA
jgi:hypothetical protein